MTQQPTYRGGKEGVGTYYCGCDCSDQNGRSGHIKSDTDLGMLLGMQMMCKSFNRAVE